MFIRIGVGSTQRRNRSHTLKVSNATLMVCQFGPEILFIIIHDLSSLHVHRGRLAILILHVVLVKLRTEVILSLLSKSLWYTTALCERPAIIFKLSMLVFIA